MLKTNQKQAAFLTVTGLIGLTAVQFIGGPALWSALAIPAPVVVPVAAYIGFWAVQAAIVLGVAAVVLKAVSVTNPADVQLPALSEEEQLQVELQTSGITETSQIFETQNALTTYTSSVK